MRKIGMAVLVIGCVMSVCWMSSIRAAEASRVPKYEIQWVGMGIYAQADKLDTFLARIVDKANTDNVRGLQQAAEAQFEALSERLDRYLAIDEASVTEDEADEIRGWLQMIVPTVGVIYQQAEELGFTGITNGIELLQTAHSAVETGGVRTFDLRINLLTGEIS